MTQLCQKIYSVAKYRTSNGVFDALVCVALQLVPGILKEQSSLDQLN